MEGNVTFIAVVIVMALGTPPFQLDDTIKPTGYDTPAECWLRTSMMIREVAMRTNVTLPVASVSTIRFNPPRKHPRKRNLFPIKGQKSRFRA